MAMTGMNALRRRHGSIKKAIEGEVFEEAGREWVDLDFVPAAQSLVHVDTGELRDSIGGEVNPQNIRVTATAEHAADEEFGNSTRGPHPYMKPAFERTRRKLPARMRQKLRTRLR